jgi:ribonuclease R
MFDFDKESYSTSQKNIFIGELDKMCSEINEKEIIIQRTERDVNDMKFAEYMQGYIGKTYSVNINGVANFGLYILLNDMIKGFISIKSLKPSDFYEYDDDKEELIGSRTGFRFYIGQNVNVRLMHADKEKRKIEFEII